MEKKAFHDLYLNAYADSQLGGDGYGFEGTIVFNGQIYALQMYEKNIVRLILMQKDAQENLSFSGKYWDMKTSYDGYATAQFVVWKGKLLIVAVDSYSYNNINCPVDFFTFDNEKITEYPRPTDPLYLMSFRLAVFKGRLCLVEYARTSSGQSPYDPDFLNVRVTDSEIPASAKDWEYLGHVRNGANDNIKFKGENSSTGLDDTWDLAVWYGLINEKPDSMLVVGRVHNGEVSAFTYEGEPRLNECGTDCDGRWREYSYITQGRREAFSLKIVQAKLYADNDPNLNPLLFFYCTADDKDTGELFCQEYYPDSNTFAADCWYTRMPYLWFGVTTAISNNPTTIPVQSGRMLGEETSLHTQYIYLVGGNVSGQHKPYDKNYTCRITSNMVKVNHQTFSDFKELLSNKETMHLCALELVVEAAPPTVVNDDWYAVLDSGSGDTFTASCLTYTLTTKLAEEVTRSLNSKTVCSLGPDTGAYVAQLSISTLITKKNVTACVKTETTTISIDANKDYWKNGACIYSVPELHRYDYFYFTPDGGFLVKGMPSATIMLSEKNNLILVRNEKLITEEGWPERIPEKDINNLSSWYRKEIPTWETLLHGQFLKGHSNSSTTCEETTKSENESAYEITVTDKVGVKKFFQLESQDGWSFRDVRSVSISKALSLQLTQLPTDNYPADAYTGYVCYLKRANRDSAVMSQYIKFLKDKGLMAVDDTTKPVVLAWCVDSLAGGKENSSES